MEVIGAIASSRRGFAPERFFNSWRGWPHLPRALGCTVLCALLLTASAACFGVTTYTYDASKRLASVSYADGTQIRYGYNLAGNIVSRVVGRVTDPVYTLDVDGSVSGSKYNALTDGLLYIRFLIGLSGPSLTNNALGSTATRLDGTAIKNYLDAFGLAGDIDGNGRVDAATDGLLVLRYLFGLRGAALIAGVAIDPLGTRKSAPEIEAYLQTLMP